jgi:hypothetical protein
MNGAAIAQLILTYGLPFAEKVWQMFNSPAVTQADWDTLKAMASQTARTKMLEGLSKAGIDPASAQGQALLALTPT